MPTNTATRTATATVLATHSIAGTVTDGAGGGIPNVIISDNAGHSTKTDSSGSFVLTGLSSGTYTLSAARPAIARMDQQADNWCFFGPSSQTVTIPAMTTVDFLGTAFCAGVSSDLSGTVVDRASGRPIENARVAIAGKRVWTNADGEFTIRSIPFGRHELRITNSNYRLYKTALSIQIGTNTHHARMRTIFTSGYRLPFPNGEQRMCTQGNNGSKSHQGVEYYAFDWSKGKGSVVAAKEGKIIEVKENFRIGGCSKSFSSYANRVKILHRDGTVTGYYHLEYKSVPVEVGQYVERGQVIGKVGATGYVCGANPAHLHFLRMKAGRYVSTEIRFEEVSTNNGIPRTGRWYRSRNTYPLFYSMDIQQEPDELPIGSVEFRFTGEPTHQLVIYGSDYESDNVQMRLGVSEQALELASWQPLTDTVPWTAPEAWAQFKDEAGNLSEVYSDTAELIGYGALQADFSVPPAICTGETIPLQNLTIPFCEQCSWRWNFDNGLTSALMEPSEVDAESGLEEWIAYDEPGNYSVTLEATGANYVSTVSKPVTVVSAPSPEFTITRSGDMITVEALELNAANWHWDFGDGTTASGRIATHVYTDTMWLDESPVPVELQVEGANSCESSGFGYVPQMTRLFLPIMRR